jgi:hypothetical protein
LRVGNLSLEFFLPLNDALKAAAFLQELLRLFLIRPEVGGRSLLFNLA